MGPKAAWYRNILEYPDVAIEVGTRTLAVTAIPPGKDEGAETFVQYAARHRSAARYMLPVHHLERASATAAAARQAFAARPWQVEMLTATNGSTDVRRFPALTGGEHNDITKFTDGFIGFICALLLAPEAVGDAVFVSVPVRAQACALIWRHGDCNGREQK